jgi:hypothetical protein
MIASFLQDLHDPKYIHVLINPLPVYGVAMGILGLIIALIQRSRRAQIAALFLILFAAISAWPVAHYGEEGYDIALSLADDPGGAWLKAHMHRADQLVWSFYVLAALAAAAIFAPLKWPKAKTGLTSITLVLAFIALGIGGYIAYAGGRVRHPEFRHEAPPPVPADADQE